MASTAEGNDQRALSCLITVGKATVLGSSLVIAASGALGVAALRMGVCPKVFLLNYSLPLVKHTATVGGVFGYAAYLNWDSVNDGILYRTIFHGL